MMEVSVVGYRKRGTKQMWLLACAWDIRVGTTLRWRWCLWSSSDRFRVQHGEQGSGKGVQGI